MLIFDESRSIKKVDKRSIMWKMKLTSTQTYQSQYFYNSKRKLKRTVYPVFLFNLNQHKKLIYNLLSSIIQFQADKNSIVFGFMLLLLHFF